MAINYNKRTTHTKFFKKIQHRNFECQLRVIRHQQGHSPALKIVCCGGVPLTSALPQDSTATIILMFSHNSYTSHLSRKKNIRLTCHFYFHKNRSYKTGQNQMTWKWPPASVWKNNCQVQPVYNKSLLTPLIYSATVKPCSQ